MKKVYMQIRIFPTLKKKAQKKAQKQDVTLTQYVAKLIADDLNSK